MELSQMKKKNILKVFIVFAVFGILQGCNEILEEHPKASFTMDVYQSRQGLQDGINAAYASLRFQYGTNPAMGINVTGTDEFTFGPEPNYNPSGDNLPHKLLGTYDVAPNQGYLLTTFNRIYPVINMLNGLESILPGLGDVPEADFGNLMGQIRYLRAHYYFLLVGQFGASSIDFGAGEYVFNNQPITIWHRRDPELLRKNFDKMIEDLTYASQNLIDARPAAEFRLSKAVALHLLSKVYLYRSYNTSLAQSSDAQNSYNAAMELLNNLSKYGAALQQDFGTVHRQGQINGANNDYNREILFAAERIPLNNLNNEYTNPGDISDRENMASNSFTGNYEQVTLVSPSGGDPIDGRPFAFQRPLRKIAPTPWLTNVAFADKTNDSRYHNSFRTLYTVETQNASGTAAYNNFVTALNAMNPRRALGDTAFYLADTPAQASALSGKYYRVYSPDTWYTNKRFPGPPAPSSVILVFPSLRKFDDANRAAPNDASGRPMPIFRLAETYLLAAEAAHKINDDTEAARLINVVRHRAAYRPSRRGMTAAQNTAANTAAVAAMTISAGDINVDFILDERARELCGEMSRWTDLAFHGDDVFVGRVKLNEDAQNVQPRHRLRPVPQAHLDALTDPDKDQLQNPGY
jgi:hypothetical protein